MIYRLHDRFEKTDMICGIDESKNTNPLKRLKQ